MSPPKDQMAFDGEGGVSGGRRERFERAGIVIDVLDAKTHELVYRNFHAADVVRGGTSSARAQRINAAVNAALGPFFK